MLHRSDRCSDDVADVRPAARLGSVAVELERAALGERKDNAGERHVRALPGPKCVEESEHDTVETELAHVGAGKVLARKLGDAVRRERLRLGVLRRRVALGRAVDGRGRREDDASAVTPRGFEHALRGKDVAAQVERENVAEAPHARLAGEMEHPVEAREVEGIHGEVDALHVEPARVLLLQRGVVVVGEAVEPDHLVACGEQRLAEVGADEPGRSGDDVAHGGTLDDVHGPTTAGGRFSTSA